MTDTDKIDIYITRDTYKKMFDYVFATKLEISGLGRVEKKEDRLVITDVAIFEQEVSGASTELDIDAIAKFMIDLDKNGEDMSLWKVWWHSHNSMSAFFSGTDTNTMQELGNTFDYLISIVLNFDKENKTQFNLFNPVSIEVGANLIVEDDEKYVVDKDIIKEVAEKVKEKNESHGNFSFGNKDKDRQPNTEVGFVRNRKGEYSIDEKKGYDDYDDFDEYYRSVDYPYTQEDFDKDEEKDTIEAVKMRAKYMKYYSRLIKSKKWNEKEFLNNFYEDKSICGARKCKTFSDRLNCNKCNNLEGFAEFLISITQ